MVADVTVLPVPGGPWITLRFWRRTCFTASSCESFSSGRPGAEMSRSDGTRACGSSSAGSWPSSLWYRYLLMLGAACSFLPPFPPLRPPPPPPGGLNEMNFFIACCIRSNDVDFHTNSTRNPTDRSVGMLVARFISSATSSSVVKRTMWPVLFHFRLPLS